MYCDVEAYEFQIGWTPHEEETLDQTRAFSCARPRRKTLRRPKGTDLKGGREKVGAKLERQSKISLVWVRPSKHGIACIVLEIKR